MCHFVLVFFSPFSIAITSLGEERANLSAFHTFVRFVLVWICRFSLPLGVWEGLQFVIVALPGLFSYLFFFKFTPPPTHSNIQELDKDIMEYSRKVRLVEYADGIENNDTPFVKISHTLIPDEEEKRC